MKKKFNKVVALTLAVSMFTVNVFATDNIINVDEKTGVGEQKNIIEKDINKGENIDEAIVGVEELVDERTSNSSTLLLSNGMKQTTYYTEDIYYENKNGEYEEYDSELVKLKTDDKKEVVKSVEVDKNEKSEYKFVNKEGDSKQFIPQNVTEDTPIVMTKDKYVISFSPKNNDNDVDDETSEGNIIDDKNIDKNIESENNDIEDDKDSFLDTNALSGELTNISLDNQEVDNVYEEGKTENKKVVVNYTDKEESIDVKYESLMHGVKETIILNEKPNSNKFEFSISLQDMYAKINPVEGGIGLYSSENDEFLGVIDAPFMNDASEENYSEDICYELIKTSDESEDNNNQKNNKYVLRLVVDEEYLNEAKYPVVIDPTVSWSGVSDLPDAYVLKAQANTNFFGKDVTTFSVGKGKQGLFRTYFGTSKLKSAVKDRYIDSAILTVYEGSNSSSGTNILVKPAAGSFKCNEITWNKQPGGASPNLASFKSKGKDKTKHEINLKKWVQNVANNSGDGHTNYGLLFRAEKEDVSNYVKFYGCRASSCKPTLKVVHYEGPSTANSVTAVSAANTSRNHLASGEKLKVSWSGISSHALNYVQYRIVLSDSDETVVKYSDSTKIGTTASGNASIDVSKLKDGKYKVYVRGVDKGGVTGTGKPSGFVIDKTKPVVSSSLIYPEDDYYDYINVLPEIAWNVKEDNLNNVQISVNNGAYTSLGASISGKNRVTGLVSGKANTVKIRAIDKAGNISSENSYTYYYDNQYPDITASINPNTNENKMDNSKDNPKLKYRFTDSTLDEYEIYLNDELLDIKNVDGEIELKDVEEGENSIELSAVDEAGNGQRMTLMYYRDTLVPQKGKVSIIPKTTENNVSSELPVIKWSGFEDDYLSEIQVKVNNGSFKRLGYSKEGQGQLASSDLSVDGKYLLTIRAVDKGGNISEEVKYNYYYEKSDYELDLYTPVDVYANEQIGGNTILRFSTKGGKYKNNIKYEVYRSLTPSVVIGKDTYVNTYTSKGAIKLTNEEGKTYYYIIRAVKEVKGEKQYSDFSDEISSMTLSETILSSRMGLSNIFQYKSFEIAGGMSSVELSHGNISYIKDDIYLPAPQLPIKITRVYNSKNDYKSSMGYGWNQSYDMYISQKDNDVYFVDGTKAVYSFKKDKEEYKCNENPDLLITIDDDVIKRNIVDEVTGAKKNEELELDVYYKLTTKDGKIYRFDEYGRLLLIEESNGTFVYIKYNKNGNISAVKTSKGQEAIYEYNTDNLLVKVTAAKDTDLEYSFEYVYDNGYLIKAIYNGLNDSKIEYKYEYTDNLLTSIYDAKNNKYILNYNDTKLDSIVYPNMEMDKFKYTNSEEKDENGNTYVNNKTNIYHCLDENTKVSKEEYTFSEDGLVKKIKDSLGNVLNISYDKNNKYLISGTSNNNGYYALIGNDVVYKNNNLDDKTEYDIFGNVKKTTDSLGNVTEYTYDYDKNEYALKSLPLTVKSTDAAGKVTVNEKYEYDKKGNIIREIDYINNTITLNKYGNDGQVVTSKELLGDNARSAAFEDTALNSYSEKNSYDSNGETDIEESKEGTVEQKTKYVYDEAGNVKIEIDNITNVEEKIIDSVSKNELSPDEIREIIKDTDIIVILYFYDDFIRNNKSISISKKDIKTTETKYDKNGNIYEEIDEKGRVTKTNFDVMNRAIRKELCVGKDYKKTSISYNYGSISRNNGITKDSLENLNVVTTKNEKGEIVSEVYKDAYGRIVRELANGIYTDYTYDEKGKVYTTYVCGMGETNPDLIDDGKLSVSTYDSQGNLTATIINPKLLGNEFKVGEDSIVTKNEYDKSGNLILSMDANGNKTNYSYDEQGRIISVSESGDKKVDYSYNQVNRYNHNRFNQVIDKTVYKNGRTIESISNGSEQLISEIESSTDGSIRKDYEYDNKGQVIKETYGDKSYITYEYDVYGRKIKKSTYSNINSNVTNSRRNELENEVEYTYDFEGNIVKEIDKKAGNPYRYTFCEYDSYGRIISISEVDSTSEPSESIINSHKLKYEYNVDDDIEKIYYPNNQKDKLKGIKFIYNKDKWIIGIDGLLSEDKTTNIRQYVYYNSGKIKKIRDYNDFLNCGTSYIEKNFEYDVFDRVTSMKYSSSNNLDKILEEYDYSYDKNSNITYKHEIFNYENNSKDEEVSYEYNNLNQLVKSVKNDNLTYKLLETEYSYDDEGNRVSENIDEKYIYGSDNNILRSESNKYKFNKLNQLISSSTEEKIGGNKKRYSNRYWYDKKGNKIEESRGEDYTDVEYSYDVENQLTDVVIKKDEKIVSSQHNEYNGNGQRIRKEDTLYGDTESKTITNYYYEGELLLYTTDDDGKKLSQNIIGNQDNIIATVRFNEDSQKGYLYSKDVQGSVKNLIDKDDNCIKSYDYSDYGETKERFDSCVDNEICYTSGVYDELTGLYYLNSRFYDSDEDVFLSEDTYRGTKDDSKSWNYYTYCVGNPINYVDPTGHNPAAGALFSYGAANGWNPTGWAALFGGVVITVGTVYVAKKHHDATKDRLDELNYNIAKQYNHKSKTNNRLKNKRKPNQKKKNKSDHKTSKDFPVRGTDGRIDVEIDSANDELTGIHFHPDKNYEFKYMYYKTGEWLIKNTKIKPPKAIRKIMKSQAFKKALTKAIRYLRNAR